MKSEKGGIDSSRPSDLAPPHEVASAKWSPDGSEIISEMKNGHLFVVRPDGSVMKPRISILITTTMFLTALTSPAWLSAQHTRYKLVDLGTFGGPESTIFIAEDNYNQVLNNRGTVTGFADTPASEPFPNFPFFDGFVTHAFGRTGSHKLRAPTAYSEPSAGITGLLTAEQGTTKIGNSTPNLLDSLDADRIRFSTTSSCALYGRPCSPNGGYPRCCGTLQCVFSGGSTRVGYACK